MEDNIKEQGPTNPDRRQALKEMAKYLAAGVFLAGCGRQAMEPTSQPTEVPEVTKEPTLKEGIVNEGESLTSAANRETGSNIELWGEFGFIWMHKDETMVYENKNAFLWQDVAPLPPAYAGDKFMIGTRDEIRTKAEGIPGVKVHLDSNTDATEDGKQIRYLTVFSDLGGRFNAPLTFRNIATEGWKVALPDNKWADAGMAKSMMNSGVYNKSSEVIVELMNNPSSN